jgi:hypothetical protein
MKLSEKGYFRKKSPFGKNFGRKNPTFRSFLQGRLQKQEILLLFRLQYGILKSGKTPFFVSDRKNAHGKSDDDKGGYPYEKVDRGSCGIGGLCFDDCPMHKQ